MNKKDFHNTKVVGYLRLFRENYNECTVTIMFGILLIRVYYNKTGKRNLNKENANLSIRFGNTKETYPLSVEQRE